MVWHLGNIHVDVATSRRNLNRAIKKILTIFSSVNEIWLARTVNGLNGAVIVLNGVVIGLNGVVIGLNGAVIGLNGAVIGLNGVVIGLNGVVIGLNGAVIGLHTKHNLADITFYCFYCNKINKFDRTLTTGKGYSRPEITIWERYTPNTHLCFSAFSSKRPTELLVHAYIVLKYIYFWNSHKE